MLRQQLEQLEGFKRDPEAYLQHQVDLYLELGLPPAVGGPGTPPALPMTPPAASAAPQPLEQKTQGEDPD
jgi:hypothetical protein